MIDGKTLLFYKSRMLRILGQYQGTEQRVDQLVTDAQINININVRPCDVRQALAALKDDGLAGRRFDDMRGEVWRITPAGHIQAAKISLDEEL